MADDISNVDVAHALESMAQIDETMVRSSTRKEESRIEVEHRQEINRIKMRQKT